MDVVKALLIRLHEAVVLTFLGILITRFASKMKWGCLYIYTNPLSVLFASIGLMAYVLLVVRLNDVAYQSHHHTFDIGYDIDIGESSHVRLSCQYTGLGCR